ncbi:MAG: peptidyl-prolyl cis-trans isomerase [Candidatus Omnitrophica bacterium]|nr:peptidyl-prolyl cis-trans isomerase [Candidatus Omnitrophota bacterium]
MKSTFFSILMLMAVFSLGGISRAETDSVVARGDWGEITAVELGEARRGNPAGASDEILIQVLARQHLAAAKALEEKLDERPDIRWRLWLAEQRAGSQEFIQERIVSGVKATPEELRAAYQERLGRYVTPETFSFRYIFSDTTECNSPAEVAKVKERIDRALAELLEPLGPDPKRPWMVHLDLFNEVAKEYSTVKGDPTRVAGPFKLDEPLQAAIKQTALALKTGEVSEVVSTKYGYEILRLENRVSAATKEFETVIGELEREIASKKREDAVDAYYQSLRDADERWDIYVERFVFLLPGAHREVPSTTYVARIGNRHWLPEELRDFMRAGGAAAGEGS